MLNKTVEILRKTGTACAKLIAGFKTTRIEPEFLKCSCPKCKSDALELLEIHENQAEHAFCVFKCRDCGASFVLWEDYIDYCRRVIMNAENEIASLSEKIKIYNDFLRRRHK